MGTAAACRRPTPHPPKREIQDGQYHVGDVERCKEDVVVVSAETQIPLESREAGVAYVCALKVKRRRQSASPATAGTRCAAKTQCTVRSSVHCPETRRTHVDEAEEVQERDGREDANVDLATQTRLLRRVNVDQDMASLVGGGVTLKGGLLDWRGNGRTTGTVLRRPRDDGRRSRWTQGERARGDDERRTRKG